MKEFFENYLKIINEDIGISSRYIDKKLFGTIGHNDVFYTSAFFNSFTTDNVEINLFVNKFIVMANIDNLKSDKEFLVYDPLKQVAVFVNVYVKGTFRHDIILISSFSSKTYPSIQKTGQVRIIF